MPEGHTIHRAARLQRKRLAGHKIEAESPQGRFAEGAALINGAMLDDIEAYGKHLFYRFDNGHVVHIHLGLFGKFRLETPPFPEPSPNARLLLSTADDRVHLAGATACDVLDPDGVTAIMDRLGPDPLRNPADGADRLGAALARRATPVARAILDQKVIAGIGNVFRSEFLFLLGIHPLIPAKEIEADQVAALWQLASDELKIGERSGRIVTVRPEDLGVTSRAKIKAADRAYVYRRQGELCRRCDDVISATEIDGRRAFWCPTCQPARTS